MKDSTSSEDIGQTVQWLGERVKMLPMRARSTNEQTSDILSGKQHRPSSRAVAMYQRHVILTCMNNGKFGAVERIFRLKPTSYAGLKFSIPEAPAL